MIPEGRVARPHVPPRSSGGRNDRGRRFLVFGFEVLRDDPVLLDGISGERVPTARVLAANAAPRQVVLEAGSVDENVDLVGRATAGRERAKADLVDAVFRDADARRERREIEEVAAGRGQGLDLLRRHVGRDFRCALHRRRGDGDRLQLHRARFQVEVRGQRGPDGDLDPALLRRMPDVAGCEVVGSRGQPRHHV